MTFIEVERKSAFASVFISREEKRNALSSAMIEELIETVESLGNEAAIRVIILRGRGSLFSSGLDLKEAQNEGEKESLALLVALLFRTIYLSPKVTVAAVHGAAYAGALGIVASCDLAVAERGALFGFPEVRRGLVPAQVIAILSQQLPLRPFKPWLLSGASFDAQEALKMGLIEQVIALDELESVVAPFLESAPGAIAETKKLLSSLASLDEAQKQAFATYHKVSGSEEAKEGLKAFIEKRKPRWQR